MLGLKQDFGDQCLADHEGPKPARAGWTWALAGPGGLGGAAAPVSGPLLPTAQVSLCAPEQLKRLGREQSGSKPADTRFRHKGACTSTRLGRQLQLGRPSSLHIWGTCS